VLISKYSVKRNIVRFVHGPLWEQDHEVKLPECTLIVSEKQISQNATGMVFDLPRPP
jgi:hypothetical protein